MPASRNPFFIRTAEQNESDDQFLNLFSLSVLDLLPEDGSWNRFLQLESAPGSGKSTLLRLFTPTVMASIARAGNRSEFEELIAKLKAVDAIDEEGVQLLGVLVNCKEDYSRLPDLRVESATPEAVFRALLHARLALLTIRAALQLAGRSYPVDVSHVRFEPRGESTLRRPDARVIDGRELFTRAQAAEEAIVNALNSFAPRPPSLPDGLAVDDVFQLLNTHRILVDDQVIARHILIMFDDAHLLDEAQREWLTRELERHDQSAFASWLAMRLRALDPPDLVSDEVVRPGRERLGPVRLEMWSQQRIERWLLDVADRRAKRAQRDVSSFAACLADSLEAEFGRQTLASIASAERERAHDLARPHGSLYRDWLARTESETVRLAPLESASRWAQLQILMERRIRRLQGEFTFESLAPIDPDRAGSGTSEPARMFMSLRNKLPYYFGARVVAQLASANVDQFLSLSATLFDRLLNGGNLGRKRTRALLPSEQTRVLVAQSRAYLNDIRTSLPYGHDVHNLVTAIAKLSHEESWRPNVPITPGVTGVSILVSERDALIEAARSSDATAVRILNALGSAIAHNALSIRVTDRLRDEDRVVFYLNRLICPAYELPLGFGGYKPQRLADLSEFVVSGEPTPQRRLGIA